MSNPVMLDFNGKIETIEVVPGTSLFDLKLKVQDIFKIPCSSQYLHRVNGVLKAEYLTEKDAKVLVSLIILGGAKCYLCKKNKQLILECWHRMYCKDCFVSHCEHCDSRQDHILYDDDKKVYAKRIGKGPLTLEKITKTVKQRMDGTMSEIGDIIWKINNEEVSFYLPAQVSNILENPEGYMFEVIDKNIWVNAQDQRRRDAKRKRMASPDNQAKTALRMASPENQAKTALRLASPDNRAKNKDRMQSFQVQERILFRINDEEDLCQGWSWGQVSEFLRNDLKIDKKIVLSPQFSQRKVSYFHQLLHFFSKFLLLLSFLFRFKPY